MTSETKQIKRKETPEEKQARYVEEIQRCLIHQHRINGHAGRALSKLNVTKEAREFWGDSYWTLNTNDYGELHPDARRWIDDNGLKAEADQYEASKIRYAVHGKLDKARAEKAVLEEDLAHTNAKIERIQAALDKAERLYPMTQEEEDAFPEE